MDAARFDDLVRALGQSHTRRRLIRLLSGLSVAGLSIARAEEASAACKPTGTRCRLSTASLCCSGICQGRKGKRKCRCPQRICCQCANVNKQGLTFVGCGFVSGTTQCSQLCAQLGANSAATTQPQPGTRTTVCANKRCSELSCVSD